MEMHIDFVNDAKEKVDSKIREVQNKLDNIFHLMATDADGSRIDLNIWVKMTFEEKVRAYKTKADIDMWPLQGNVVENLMRDRQDLLEQSEEIEDTLNKLQYVKRLKMLHNRVHPHPNSNIRNPDAQKRVLKAAVVTPFRVIDPNPPYRGYDNIEY